MAIKGFCVLTSEEMEGITGGGFSCPRSRAEFQRTFNALTYEQQKAYIKYCYEHNCSQYF
ncbi:MAG: hypothetical protein QM793_12525 [Muricomes sp.]